jgi:hypothetical protein
LVKQIISKSTGKVLFVTSKMHSFETNVPFSRVTNEIDNLRMLLKTLNPKEVKNFRVVQGKTGAYLMSDSPLHIGNARLLCEENAASVMDFSHYAREHPVTNETVLLSDKIIVSDTRIKCSSPNSNGIWDTECITRITSLAVRAGLSFHATEKELYRYLTEDPGKKSFHLAVNSTH